MRGVNRSAALLCALLCLSVPDLGAQGNAGGPGGFGPDFMLAGAASREPVRVEPSRVGLLQKVITVRLDDVPLQTALDTISAMAGLSLVYSADVVPVNRRVSLSDDEISVAAALAEVLRGTNVNVVISGRQAALVRRSQPAAPADTGSVYGFVRLAETGQPLAAVQVVLDGRRGTLTNDRGIFYFTGVEAGEHTIEAMLIGYKTATARVVVVPGQPNPVILELEISPARLDEIVVTASGEERRRVEIGNDIVVIRADSIVAKEPIASIADLLEGRVPGLVVQRTSGAPGDPTRIRIRGSSSPTLSNDPIIIVDGVRVYSEQSNARGGNLANLGYGTSSGSKYNAPSPLDYIDPSMVESIQVVKGPSAATMYGQDAANGVIVITTKKGQPGTTSWMASMDYGVSQLPVEYPTRYVRLGRSMTDDRRVVCPANGWLGGDASFGETCLPDSEVLAYQALRDPYVSVLDRGRSASMNVGVSGGASGLTYAVTASYLNEEGIVKLSDFEADRFRAQHGREPFDWMKRPQNFTRWGVNSRVQAQLSRDLTVALTTNLSRLEQQRSELETTYTRLDGIYIDRSTGQYYEVGTHASGGLTSTLVPIEPQSAFYERATSRTTQFTNALNVNWRPRHWLTVKADAGLNLVNRADEIFVPAGFDNSSLIRADGDLSRGQGTSVTSTVNLQAFSQVPIGLGFSLRMSAGANYKGESIEDVNMRATELPEGVSTIVGSLGSVSASERRSNVATYGWYVAPGIAHRRMWLDLGLRFDGGSTFGTRVKLPTFPRITYSYLISDEPFFPEALLSVFDELRLRVAYGHAGRQPGPTDRLRLFTSPEIVVIDGRTVEAIELSTLGNTKIKPERTAEFETGFDAGMFDDRLSLAFTVYQKTTKDALLSVPVAPSVYGTSVRQLMNIGVVRNSGLELALGMEPVRRDFLTWRVDLTFGQNRNKVLELGEGVEPFWTERQIVLDGGTEVGVNGTRVVAGYPLHGRWSTPILGYADANGDGFLDASEVVFGDTAVYVGTTLPNYEAGLQSTLTLFRGAVSVSASLTYTDGLTQWNSGYNPMLARGWHDPERLTLIDQLKFHDKVKFSMIETIHALRLNSLAVSWQVPRVYAGMMGAKSLTVSLLGSNLGLWSNYSGLDPNVNSAVGGNNVYDQGALPSLRTYQVRVNATF